MSPLSLRSQLLLVVGGPFVVLLLSEAIVSYRIGLHAANQVYDQWLLDRGNMIVQAYADGIDLEDGSYASAITDVSYRIETRSGEFVAGDSALPSVSLLDGNGAPVFQTLSVNDVLVRTVGLGYGSGERAINITVVESIERRSENNYSLFVDVLITNSLVVLLALLMIGTAFGRGLRPLTLLGQELGHRSPQDLTPIDVGSVPSELRGVVENTNTLLSRIDAAISSREQFIGNIAHQIRTPHAGIKLQAQLAQADHLDNETHTSLEKISHAADTMTHVNSQLMKLARAEAASGRGLRRVPINLSDVARNCHVELEAQAAAKDITLHLELADSPQIIEGEFTLVSEMVGNLIENAIIYTQAGGSVWVSVDSKNGNVMFAVEDNGPGTSEAHWPQIFDRFFRPAPAVGEGCGLGLAIVREIAMAHGASVELESGREGRGARFFVLF